MRDGRAHCPPAVEVILELEDWGEDPPRDRGGGMKRLPQVRSAARRGADHCGAHGRARHVLAVDVGFRGFLTSAAPGTLFALDQG